MIKLRAYRSQIREVHKVSLQMLKYILFINLSLISLSIGCTSSTNEGTTIIDPNGEGATVAPLIDSNTNWLLSCSADSDCNEGEQCSCGSCVIPCSPMGGVGASCMISMDHHAPETIECVEADPVSQADSCGEDYSRGQVGICLLGCEVNDDCPEHLLCHENRCVRPRRGESRGCGDERECIEAGGAPERCRVLCEEEMEGGMSIEREPPPPMRELIECESHCIEDGYSPEACRSRCAVCEERCLLIDDPREAQECEMRCMHHADDEPEGDNDEPEGADDADE